MSLNPSTIQATHPRAAFKHQDFRLYATGRFLALVAYQMMAIGVGQQVFELTHDPFHLGLIGLSLFLPKFGFTLFAGQTADRFDRRRIILICRFIQFLSSIGLCLFALTHSTQLGWLYALLFLIGTTNAFEGPASQALVPHLIPPEHLGNAITWNSSIMQLAFIIGPALGGWVYWLGGSPILVFICVIFIRLIALLLVWPIKTRTGRLQASEVSLKTLLAGIHFVWDKKIILGAISLDLFAVLFGGAVALMPIFANDILKVGPTGLGFLRAAPSVGAGLMAIVLAYQPPLKKAGATMFWCVALFGVATIVFGLSKNFFLSLAALVVLGASDMVSMVVRGVLVQSKTPPEMRGRVSAVSLIFIGASNELGEFESGLTASWFGTVPAVIIGGLGTLAVVSIWAWKFPELRKLEKLH